MSSLYIYELSVQSSYSENREYPATEDSFDTVQRWLCGEVGWRIRTYDRDSDIHIHRLGKSVSIDSIEELMRKRYSGVLVGRYDFPVIDIEDNQMVVDKMKSGSLEVSKDNNYAFWNHDNRRYTSKPVPPNG